MACGRRKGRYYILCFDEFHQALKGCNDQYNGCAGVAEIAMEEPPIRDVMQFLRDLMKRQKEEGAARIEMYQQVGRAIVTLSEIEEALAEVYVFLSAANPEKKSAKKFYKQDSIREKVKLVDAAVDASTRVKRKELWKPLSSRIVSQNMVRNEAAHASVEFHVERASGKWRIAIGTQARKPRKRKDYYIDDVKAAADELHDIWVGIRQFLQRQAYDE